MLWRTPAVVTLSLCSRAKGERLCDVVDAAHFHDAVDFGAVEAARVVDAAAELRPFHAGERQDRLDALEVYSLRVSFGRGLAILLAHRIRGESLQLAKTVNTGHRNQDRDRRNAGFETSGMLCHSDSVPLGIQRNSVTGSVPVFTSHIVVVSVTTDTNVPNSTEPDACATQVSYCRAMMNTLSAGGNAAISTAV
jgi:hypothetical protein